MTTENFAVQKNQLGKRRPVTLITPTVKEILLTGTGKTYYAPDPNMRTNVFLKKDGSTAKVSGTNSEVDPVDNATFISLEPNAGPASVDDFFGGDSGGFTGIEIDVTAYVNDLTLIITSYVLDETP